MHRILVTLKKLPGKYDELDFYDEPEVVYINNHLYQDIGINRSINRATDRSIFIIYPRDIEMIFGLPPGRARQFLFEIREAVAIDKKDLVSIGHFCKYTGIDMQTVKDYIAES